MHVHHGAERARGKAFADGGRRRRPGRSPRTRWPPGTRPRCAEIDWRPGGRRRGAGDQERRHPAGDRGPVASRPRHRIAVTGTPVENRLADLWSIMEFANPGLLGQRRDVQEALRRADRAARRRRGGRPAARGSPGRSCCAASRPTSRSSPTCRRSWRWRCSATSPPSRPRSTRPWSTTCWTGSRTARASSGAAWCWPR